VIEDAVVAAAETEGLRIGNEMNLVASRGKFNAKLGGDYSRAAVGGVSGDADTHAAALHFRSSSRRNNVETTIKGPNGHYIGGFQRVVDSRMVRKDAKRK
jgi:hypothetical protein